MNLIEGIKNFKVKREINKALGTLADTFDHQFSDTGEISSKVMEALNNHGLSASRVAVRATNPNEYVPHKKSPRQMVHQFVLVNGKFAVDYPYCCVMPLEQYKLEMYNLPKGGGIKLDFEFH